MFFYAREEMRMYHVIKPLYRTSRIEHTVKSVGHTAVFHDRVVFCSLIMSNISSTHGQKLEIYTPCVQTVLRSGDANVERQFVTRLEVWDTHAMSQIVSRSVMQCSAIHGDKISMYVDRVFSVYNDNLKLTSP